jgi:pimeloyl-ACP methyl ester carboxylesterase
MIRELQIGKDQNGNPSVWTLNERAPDWSSPVCLLLHGYNVESQGAASNYKRLFHTIEATKTLLPPLLDSRSWVVYWQGYASGGLAPGKTLSSPFTYASQISSARKAAEALRRYIDERSPTRFAPQITLIAHSLGCRVALELLDSYARFPTKGTPEFPLIVLMAAAVPAYFFEDLARLWKGALLPETTLVLFSRRDWILAVPFRAGQTQAGEGVFPEAVGATGRPGVGFWTRVVCTHNGHSGYFEDPQTAAEIAHSLGQAPPKGLPVLCEREAVMQPTNLLPALKLASRLVSGEQR